MIQEFKDFINKGNVFETAVGLILALAFTPVVQGFVDLILMPIIAAIVGQPDFSDIDFTLGDATIEIGSWINLVVSFLLIALVLFFIVRAYNRANKPVEAEAEGPSEIDLLTEIRDNLSR